MNVHFDYDPAACPGTEARGHGCADQLLACYQQALGHELPNLLVSLQGLARLLADEPGGNCDPDTRAMLGRLAELARRADTLVRSTAALGRTLREAGPATAIPLHEAVREALAEVNLLSIGADVEYDVASDMPTLMVSRRVLHQVLVQLLGNAARAGVSGRPLRIGITARRCPDGVEAVVVDNGRGIPDEVARHLGEPFVSGGGGGFGLGLFLVRLLIAARGGALHVLSEPGGGTRVTVLFRQPILDRTEPEPRPGSQ